MKKRAFTVAEILVTLTVIGVIAAIAASNSLGGESLKEKKLESTTHTFYSGVELAMNEMVFYENDAKKGIKNLTSEQLMELMTKQLDGDSIESEDTCKDFVGGDELISNGAVCSKIPPEFIVGFKVDSECKSKVMAYEYKSKKLEAREIKNACGYIVYEPEKSKGIFGKDLFVIALGNRHLK